MEKLDGKVLGDGDGVGRGCWIESEGRESLECQHISCAGEETEYRRTLSDTE